MLWPLLVFLSCHPIFLTLGTPHAREIFFRESQVQPYVCLLVITFKGKQKVAVLCCNGLAHKNLVLCYLMQVKLCVTHPDLSLRISMFTPATWNVNGGLCLLLKPLTHTHVPVLVAYTESKGVRNNELGCASRTLSSRSCRCNSVDSACLFDFWSQLVLAKRDTREVTLI